MYDIRQLNRFCGKVERIGLPQSSLKVLRDSKEERREISAADHESAIGAIIDLLSSDGSISPPVAIGHRIVHGGPRYAPASESHRKY